MTNKQEFNLTEKIIEKFQLGVDQKDVLRAKTKLRARMAKLGISRESNYYSLVCSPNSTEKSIAISLITTHYTYFNREPFQFRALESWLKHQLSKGESTIVFWSFGCSTGQEVYTLATWLESWREKYKQEWDYKIKGMDIDPVSIQHACNGVYQWSDIERFPPHLVGRYWQRGSRDISKFGRIHPHIHRKCQFKVANILNAEASRTLTPPHAIFARNVLIYFEKEAQEKICQTFCDILPPGGLLVTGISEAVVEKSESLTDLGNSLFQKVGDKEIRVRGETNKDPIELSFRDQPAIVCRYQDGKSLVVDQVDLSKKSSIQRALSIVTKSFEGKPNEIEALLFCQPQDVQPLKNLANKIFQRMSNLSVSKKGGIKIDTSSGKISGLQESGRSGYLRITSTALTRILVVEDDKTMQMIIKASTKNSKSVEIIGVCTSAEEAEEFIKANRPDVVSLDIHLPGEDGISFYKRFLHPRGIPAVVMSGGNDNLKEKIASALLSGVSDYIVKPTYKELEGNKQWFESKLKAAAENPIQGVDIDRAQQAHFGKLSIDVKQALVVVGASTGGVAALDVILRNLPTFFPPILISLHMSEDQAADLAKLMDQKVSLKVKIAKHNEAVVPSTVYFAPGDKNMLVKDINETLTIELRNPRPEDLATPVIDELFISTSQIPRLERIGLLLTGMGSDGARGLQRLKASQATTICQGESSCVVFGMPKAAIAIGAATKVVELEDIPTSLVEAFTTKGAA